MGGNSTTIKVSIKIKIMTQLLKKIEPFDKYVLEYDQWFERHPAVFKSEVEALREMMPFTRCSIWNGLNLMRTSYYS